MAAGATLARSSQGRVLVASSRAEFRANMIAKLSAEKSPAAEAAGGADALMKLERGGFQTLLLDPHIEDLDADELVDMIQTRYPELNVVLMGVQAEAEQLSLDLAEGDTGAAVEEPAEADESAWLEGEERAATPSPAVATATSSRIQPLPGMIGTSAKMEQIYRLARLVAPRDTTVLIVGSTGTGKELVARGIHELSRRSRGPFVVVNCAAIPESLLEAELFGFARGAFTGAVQSRLGRIHAAHGGTLFLDEVGELPLSMQAKLLRFVQEGEVQRLGSADLFRVDTRVIAATNADLLQRVREKQFREDLYYRLAVFPLDLPSLESRADDILPLARQFLESFCKENGVAPKTIHPDAAILLKRHNWPGNVRELQHSIERAFVLADGNPQIRPEDLSMPREAA
ncbi:MAG TPA: sigma-54 dependent transcriptional regulator [Candidatus Acidoferrales bacterium]|nr:sigma-54 dependent transcriptional regulator [Candidatus Acidoferrales bacterium]